MSRQPSPRRAGSSVSKPGAASASPTAGPPAQPKEADLYNPTTLLTVSQQHKDELRTAFDMFDTDGTGRIPAHEVKVALYALGYDVSKAEINKLLKDVGVDNTNNDALIDFNDFYGVLVRKMTAREVRLDSVRAFKQIDEDNKGHISLADLRGISNMLGLDLTDDELFEMIMFAHPVAGGLAGGAADLDAKESMVVPEEEFLKLMKRANVY